MHSWNQVKHWNPNIRFMFVAPSELHPAEPTKCNKPPGSASQRRFSRVCSLSLMQVRAAYFLPKNGENTAEESWFVEEFFEMQKNTRG